MTQITEGEKAVNRILSLRMTIPQIYTLLKLIESRQEEFIKDKPPGSPVWENPNKSRYATTVGDMGIYQTPLTNYVEVKGINGDPSTSDSWHIDYVVKLTPAEMTAHYV